MTNTNVSTAESRKLITASRMPASPTTERLHHGQRAVAYLETAEELRQGGGLGGVRQVGDDHGERLHQRDVGDVELGRHRVRLLAAVGVWRPRGPQRHRTTRDVRANRTQRTVFSPQCTLIGIYNYPESNNTATNVASCCNY